MPATSPSMGALARRLLAASRATTAPRADHTTVVVDSLRPPLTRLAGSEGFASLLRRAVALASANAPSLQNVRVGADGSLKGIEEPAAGTGGTRATDDAAAVITEQLLELLVTFIGEGLTLRLVREAWPDTCLDEYETETKAD